MDTVIKTNSYGYIKKGKVARKASELAAWLLDRHPWILFFAAFVGIPISLVAVVMIITAVIMVPIAILAGWPL